MWVTFRHISKPVLNEQACLRHHSKGDQTSQQGCQDNGCQFCFHSMVSILLEIDQETITLWLSIISRTGGFGISRSLSLA